DLADPEPPGAGQNGDEPVQLPVDEDFLEDLGPVALESAIMVMQRGAGQTADHPVEDPAREDLVPGVVPGALPAADDVEPLPPFEQFEEPGDLPRVVLQVGVEGEDDRAPGAAEPGGQGRGLAEVPAEAEG